MLKIIEGGENINNNNEKVATIKLSDCTVWQLKDYMFVEWSEWTHTTHEELYECGWVQDWMHEDIIDYMNDEDIELNLTSYKLQLLAFILEGELNDLDVGEFIEHGYNNFKLLYTH